MMKQTKLSDFFQKPHSPTLPQAKSSLARTAKEALQPLFIRPIPEHPKYQKQLEEEYELIDKNNFVQVFLQVRTILELITLLGEESGQPIPHIIRGSAGSSLLCYLLGITHIDPILYGIQLARFMNSLRKDIPDIDIDVPYNRREEIYERIAATWPSAVARISNYCMWSNKTALRESIKEVLKESNQAIPSALTRKHYTPEKILDGPQLKEAKRRAELKKGTLKNYSKHCGGIVIFEDEGEVPEELILHKKESIVQINLNKDDTEAKGFIKIDVLSNRGLAQIAQICPERPFTHYPTRDPKTERILEKGWNLGITFGESRGMRKLFMEMKPQGVKDLAVALALIRPAAAAEGRKQEFLKKWNDARMSAEDPIERPIVYDDDAICKIRRAMGCSAAEADRWRKAFAKGNARARLDFRKIMSTMGHSQDTINMVVDDLNQLVYYSFCKSHAISYAQLVWALAYWKAHRTHEFWAAALTHCHSEFRKWVHYREARCSGLLLTTSPPPYKVGVRDGEAALVSSHGQQQLLKPLNSVEEFRQFGFWTQESFLPTCGMWMKSQQPMAVSPLAGQRLDGKKECSFRGLIATCRTINRDWGKCTMICLGVENRRYIDLIIPEKHRSDLFRWAVLEGEGILTKEDTVEVTKIHGLSLQRL
jgi:DNA polymerase III alpha subunit